jgi:segregation and condensation protein A
MDKTPASEAIAILIDLAQKGEIDPWDVQVIDVIDRFLQEIEKNSEMYREKGLSYSGQAFLWASMLVLFKADTLEQLDIQEIEEVIEEELEEIEGKNKRNLPINLENYIKRRPAGPITKKRRVTLKELIEHIQQIAAEIESKPVPTPKRNYNSRRENIRVINELAHNENLTEMAGQLDNFLDSYFHQLANNNEWLYFDNLLQGWHEINGFQHSEKNDNQEKKPDKVGIFWALLLLSSQSKVELFQEEFYQDLSVKPISSLANLKSG